MTKKIIERKKVNGSKILESYKPSKKLDGPILGSFSVADVIAENTVSKNYTYYPSETLQSENAFGKGGRFFNADGTLIPAKLMGSLDHPLDGAAPEVRLESNAIAWRELSKEGTSWNGKADILNTPAGKILKTHLDYAKEVGGGDFFGVSIRALGEQVEHREASTSYTKIVPDGFEILSIDFVYEPSFGNTSTLLESSRKVKPLYESIKKLAKEDSANADVYEAYAKLLIKENKEVLKENEMELKTESKVLGSVRKEYIQKIKDEINELQNSHYELDKMSEEDFNKKYKGKNKQSILDKIEKEILSLKAEKELLSREKKEAEEVKEVKEATKLDKTIEELEDDEEVIEEFEEELEEDKVDEEEELEEEESEEEEELDEESEEEELDEEPTLKELLNAIEELKAEIEDLKISLAPVEDDFLEGEFEIELTDEEELPEEPAEDEELPEEEVEELPAEDELTEEDLENMSEEELLAYLEKENL